MYQYSVEAIVAAHTALLGVFDSDTDPAYITIHDASNVLLGTITLQKPSGSIDGATGQITLQLGANEASAPNAGHAAYGQIHDGAGDVHLTLDTVVSATPVSGYLALNTLDIVAGAPIELLSATIG